MRGFITARPDPLDNEGQPLKIRLLLLWLVVGIPLLWGISKTLQNALKLFS